MEDADSTYSLRQIILNTKEPLLISNQIHRNLLSWSLEEWKELLGHEILQFRCGKNHYTEEPQWESTCEIKKAKFEEFLENSHSNVDEWWYFDYKYLCQWFKDKEILKQEVEWSALGFPEFSSDDSTIWIGSKGAHTSCHKDTYGCNIVLQVFGRKQWLLFPPEQNLKPTRIPFEESSIYSKLNFFSPNVAKFKGISLCYKVILNPGELLVVPNKWWHYVENLETAISINAWLPLPQDEFQRIKESIGTIFVRQVTQMNEKYPGIILNPNMLEEMVSSDAALNIITASTERCKPKNKIQKSDEETLAIDKNSNVEELLNGFKNISKIPILNKTEFNEFLIRQFERFDTPIHLNMPMKNDYKQIIDFLEVVTDDEVLDLIAKKLIEKT